MYSLPFNLLLLKQFFFPYGDLFNEEELNRIWIIAVNKFKINDAEAITYLDEVLREKIKKLNNLEERLQIGL